MDIIILFIITIILFLIFIVVLDFINNKKIEKTCDKKDIYCKDNKISKSCIVCGYYKKKGRKK